MRQTFTVREHGGESGKDREGKQVSEKREKELERQEKEKYKEITCLES